MKVKVASNEPVKWSELPVGEAAVCDAFPDRVYFKGRTNNYVLADGGFGRIYPDLTGNQLFRRCKVVEVTVETG